VTAERLQRVLARAGLASRRACERLIVEGRISVNGTIVTTLGTKIDPMRDVVRVDGKRIALRARAHTYLMLNKPRGCVTTLHDPEGRPTVRDLVKGVRARVYPVGRLDFDSEGLLLLTDDGDLARALMHPSGGVVKTYLAKVRGQPPAEALARVERGGILLGGRPTLPATARIVRQGANPWLEIGIVEGRNRQVRRVLEVVGHPVLRLRRVGYGPLRLGSLAPGQSRPLRPEEVRQLRRTVGARSAVIR